MNLAGNTILVQANGNKLRCQLDSTFTSSSNFTANQPCKGDAKAETQTLTSQTWNVSFNGKSQTGTDGTADQNFLLDAQQAGTLVQIAFAPDPAVNNNVVSNWVITGYAYVSEVVINAAVDGESTYTGTFIGTGNWVKTVVPVNFTFDTTLTFADATAQGTVATVGVLATAQAGQFAAGVKLEFNKIVPPASPATVSMTIGKTIAGSFVPYVVATVYTGLVGTQFRFTDKANLVYIGKFAAGNVELS